MYANYPSNKIASNCSKAHSASDIGHTEAVKLLPEKGTDVTVVSKDGWTPLNSALRNGYK
jgi:ankyrin repeat protein